MYHLVLEARGSCISGPNGTETIGKSSHHADTQRALHRQQTETHPKCFREMGLFSGLGA